MPSVGGAGEGIMSRWQYWQQERGGDKNAAMMELVACFMVSLLIVYALFWYGQEAIHSEGGSAMLMAMGSYALGGLDSDIDYSEVPFSTAAYFLYVFVLIALFSSAWLSRQQKGAPRAFIVGSGVIFLLICSAFVTVPSASAIHTSSIADIGFLSSIWYFHRSHLLNLFFTGFIFRDKWKTDDEIEKELEELGEPVQVRSSFLDNLTYIIFLLFLVFAWVVRALFAWATS